MYWGVNKYWVHEISRKIECRFEELPVTYLGVPLGANSRRRSRNSDRKGEREIGYEDVKNPI